MTDQEQEQHGFDSVSNKLSQIKAGSIIGAYHTAHIIWVRLGWSDSPYVEGCRKACRMYFCKSHPTPKILREIEAARREAHGM